MKRYSPSLKKGPDDPDYTEIVVDGEEKERAARQKKKEELLENTGLKRAIGENQFQVKYKRRPRDLLYSLLPWLVVTVTFKSRRENSEGSGLACGTTLLTISNA